MRQAGRVAGERHSKETVHANMERQVFRMAKAKAARVAVGNEAPK